jgi:dTDP-4-amino-4,6-dideoxy-D-galactose acyltransferase
LVTLLQWDTDFFKKKIGVLSGELSSERAVADDLAAARTDGYAYLTCRPGVEDAVAIRTLERAGFYLTDVGVTWSSETARYLSAATEPTGAVRLATADDLPLLSAEAVKLFRRSRFYSDPFFTESDADRLHVAWLTNSVSGQAADAVLISPEAGFVTCKLTKDGNGEVPLIGVWEQSRNRGAGRELMTAAVAWFSGRGAPVVRVKTQVKNLRAMNFYHRLGFDLHAMDMTMCCMLQPMVGGGTQ